MDFLLFSGGVKWRGNWPEMGQLNSHIRLFIDQIVVTAVFVRFFTSVAFAYVGVDGKYCTWQK